MTRGGGGWRYWNSKLAVQSFRSPPPLLLVLKYTNFRSPPPSPTIFSEPPCRVSKYFRSSPQYLHPPPPLVILNELSQRMAQWQEHSPSINAARVGAIFGSSSLLVLPLFRGFFSGFSGFPPSTETNTLESNSARIEQPHENQLALWLPLNIAI